MRLCSASALRKHILHRVWRQRLWCEVRQRKHPGDDRCLRPRTNEGPSNLIKLTRRKRPTNKRLQGNLGSVRTVLLSIGHAPETSRNSVHVSISWLNRPGESGDSVPWKGWSHVWSYVEEVSGRVA